MKLWKTLFSSEEIEIIESINTENTLENYRLLFKLVMGILRRELKSPDSTNSIRLFDIARRLLEDIGSEQTLQDNVEDDFKRLLDEAKEDNAEEET